MVSSTTRGRRKKRAAGVAAAAGLLLMGAPAAFAQTATNVPESTPTCDVKRPVPGFNRWQEDWGVLANPCLPRRPFDGPKYIPLSRNDPTWYLSLGANLRERFELNNTPLFGLGSARPDNWVIQRAEVHADARFGEHVQAFFQLEDARPFGKDSVTPVDKNPLDIEQAFVAFVYGVGGGTFKARVGRQEMAFDLQRFVSVRDGPNVRQAFDALWADYEIGKWRFIGYLTQPVQYRDAAVFDDVSNGHLTFSGVRV
ncbi:alginate export protein, partial [Paraburkholderia unamae]|uniref:alginate export family protein n=1 Tax=Paraburkholderia unamae TaxID=219649 RepID=UPI000DC5F537